MKKQYTAQATFKRLKSTLNIDRLDYRSIEVDGVDPRDYPDFCDAYISYAEYTDGTALTEDEIDTLNEDHSDIIYEAVVEHF